MCTFVHLCMYATIATLTTSSRTHWQKRICLCVLLQMTFKILAHPFAFRWLGISQFFWVKNWLNGLDLECFLFVGYSESTQISLWQVSVSIESIKSTDHGITRFRTDLVFDELQLLAETTGLHHVGMEHQGQEYGDEEYNLVQGVHEEGSIRVG